MTMHRKGRDCNPDFAGATAALERAALRARELARATGTDLIVQRDGKLVRVPPQDIELPVEDVPKAESQAEPTKDPRSK